MKSFRMAIGLILLLCNCGCSVLNKKAGLPDDNIVEEIAESIIQNETGLNIDLTPSTPEKKQ